MNHIKPHIIAINNKQRTIFSEYTSSVYNCLRRKNYLQIIAMVLIKHVTIVCHQLFNI